MSSQDGTTRPERSTGQRARDQLLDAMPVTERQLALAGVSTAVLEGRCRPAGRAAARPGRVRSLLDYALDRARTPNVQAALRRLIPRLAMPPIPATGLAQITVPTTLIHGRYDLQVRLRTAEAASAKFGWPLHVIDDCRDDPAAEQPAAFLDALRTAIRT